jgi:hypothetical protein
MPFFFFLLIMVLSSVGFLKYESRFRKASGCRVKNTLGNLGYVLSQPCSMSNKLEDQKIK